MLSQRYVNQLLLANVHQPSFQQLVQFTAQLLLVISALCCEEFCFLPPSCKFISGMTLHTNLSLAFKTKRAGTTQHYGVASSLTILWNYEWVRLEWVPGLLQSQSCVCQKWIFCSTKIKYNNHNLQSPVTLERSAYKPVHSCNQTIMWQQQNTTCSSFS